MIVPKECKLMSKYYNTCKIYTVTTHYSNDEIDICSRKYRNEKLYKKPTTRSYFIWSKRGIEALETYRKIKVGNIPDYSVYKKPNKPVLKLSKQELLDKRPFSTYHNKLISESFGKVHNELKQAAEQTAHEIRIKNLAARLKLYKYSLKFRNSKNCKYKIVVWIEDKKHKPIIFTEKYVPNVTQAVHEAAKTYNSNMSKYMFYHHTSIYDIENKRPVAIFTRNLIEFKEAVTMCAA